MAGSGSACTHLDAHVTAQCRAAGQHTATTAATAHMGAAATTTGDDEILHYHLAGDRQGVGADSTELMHPIGDTLTLDEIDAVTSGGENGFDLDCRIAQDHDAVSAVSATQVLRRAATATATTGGDGIATGVTVAGTVTASSLTGVAESADSVIGAAATTTGCIPLGNAGDVIGDTWPSRTRVGPARRAVEAGPSGSTSTSADEATCDTATTIMALARVARSTGATGVVS